jgi:heme exporter protein D
VLAFIPFGPVITTQLSHMLAVTLAVYAVARGLNAVVSMAQGTELSIEPLGVGVTLAPGEILDPLNDLIEQVSSVLLIASASLGMQKIVVAVGDITVFRWLIVVLSLVSLATLFIKKISNKPRTILIRVVIIATLLRAIVPIMVMLSNYSQQWLSHDREQAMTVLVDTQKEVSVLNQSTGHDQSWLEGVRNSLDIEARIQQVKQQGEQAIQAAIYILSEFLLVFVMLPIVLGFVLLQLIRKLTTF